MIPLITGSASSVTTHVRAVGHLASLFVLGGLLFGLTCYTGYTAKRRTQKANGSTWYKWGPTILVGIASWLILADTIRHVLQDQGIWLEGHERGFVFGPSNEYVCAASHSHCCPAASSDYGNAPYTTIYPKNCTLRSVQQLKAAKLDHLASVVEKHHNLTGWLDPRLPEADQDLSLCDPAALFNKQNHVDLPWTLACDAGISADKLNQFLKFPCYPVEGRTGTFTIEGQPWGCSCNIPECSAEKATNQQALVAFTSNDYLFGKGFTKLDSDNYQGTDGYFADHLANGCHSNEYMSCLGGTGIIFTALFSYAGFILLTWGSLWNANLLQKLGKMKAQWQQLRGTAPVPSSRALSSVRGSGHSGVIAITTDQDFDAQVQTGGTLIVDFTADFCKPCKAIAPTFASLASKYGGKNCAFVQVDVEDCKEAAEKFEVSAMPTFVCIQNGQKINSLSGADKAKLTTFVENSINGSVVDVDDGECKT